MIQRSQFKRRTQCGAVLLAMVSMLVAGASWWVVSSVNNLSNRTAIKRTHNAAVLMQAKQALVAWIAVQASLSSESNPGRLPCPEAGAYISDTDPDNDGVAAGNCTLPAVGRLPWRTLGLDKLLDADGEPLWYSVSDGWALPFSTATLTINSNSTGSLTVDGQANAAVALIIAPGPAINVAASTGCTARGQARNATNPDLRDYLECENAASPADASFATSGPSGSFNDQVLKVTTSDILPTLEAVIANRIERDIVPYIQSAYASSEWGNSTANPVFPYAAALATTTYKGSTGSLGGLIPLTYSEDSSGNACSVADTRCDPDHVQWVSSGPDAPTLSKVSGSPTIYSSACSTGATTVTCTYYVSSTATSGFYILITATAQDVGTALRRLDTSTSISGLRPAETTISAALNTDATATISVNGRPTFAGYTVISNCWPLTGWGVACYLRTATLPFSVIRDNTLLSRLIDPTSPDPDPSPDLRWFVRNGWHALTYYGVARGNQPGRTSTCSGTSGSSACLTVTNATNSSGNRAIVVLAGRSLGTQDRTTSPTLVSSYLESANATGDTLYGFQGAEVSAGDYAFTKSAVNSAFNDRVVVIDAN